MKTLNQFMERADGRNLAQQQQKFKDARHPKVDKKPKPEIPTAMDKQREAAKKMNQPKPQSTRQIEAIPKEKKTTGPDSFKFKMDDEKTPLTDVEKKAKNKAQRQQKQKDDLDDIKRERGQDLKRKTIRTGKQVSKVTNAAGRAIARALRSRQNYGSGQGGSGSAPTGAGTVTTRGTRG